MMTYASQIVVRAVASVVGFASSSRTAMVIAGLAVVLVGGTAPAHAGFGTTVGFGQGAPEGPMDPGNNGISSSQLAEVVSDGLHHGTVAAKAAADGGSFSTGTSVRRASALDAGWDLGLYSYAMAATDLQIEGEFPADGIAASLVLDGTFGFVPGPFPGEMGFGTYGWTYLDVLGFGDYHGFGSTYDELATRAVEIQPSRYPGPYFDLPGTAPDFEEVRVPWTGSGVVDFTIPFGTTRLVVRHLSYAEVYGGDEVDVDFLSTATLSILPSPGMVVTLDTGQRFVGAAASAVPEPGTLTLLGGGALGLLHKLRRRKHSV
jgi:hypothetical protein